MIKSFANPMTEDIFHGKVVQGLSIAVQQRALAKLQLIQAAGDLRDLEAVSTNRLEVLSGEREGRHCICVDDKGRICFKWRGSHAYDVELFGYH